MLPFRQRCEIREQVGTLVAMDVPISVWPATGSTTRAAGVQSDHMGEAPLDRYDQLRGKNRRIIVTRGPMTGLQLAVVAAVEQTSFPHVQLELKSTGRV